MIAAIAVPIAIENPRAALDIAAIKGTIFDVANAATNAVPMASTIH